MARRRPAPGADALPPTAWAVLGLLSFGRELSGYDLKKWADNSLRFFYWSPATSQIYGELARLEKLGLAAARPVPQDDLRSKRVYRITPAGRDALAEWVESSEPEPAVLKHPTLLRVWLGHLADPQRLRAVVEAHLASVEALVEEARHADEGAAQDRAWAYPHVVTRWSVRYLENEVELTRALLADLDAVAPA